MPYPERKPTEEVRDTQYDDGAVFPHIASPAEESLNSRILLGKPPGVIPHIDQGTEHEEELEKELDAEEHLVKVLVTLRPDITAEDAAIESGVRR